MPEAMPFAFVFMDYERKVTGFGPTLVPTGDVRADMVIIRDFYQDIEAKFPEKFSDIRMKVESARLADGTTI